MHVTKFIVMHIKKTSKELFHTLRGHIRGLLNRIDETEHTPSAKLWMYQNDILSRLYSGTMKNPL